MNAEVQLDFVPWARVPLRSGLASWTLIDERDLDLIEHWRWNSIYKRPWTDDQCYVRRAAGPNRTTIYLHRIILQRADPRSPRFMREHVVDHVNGQTLDNRRSNLRWATRRQNALNCHLIIPSLDDIIAALPTPVEFEMPF